MEKGNALHLFKSLQPNKKGIHHLVQLRNASVIDVSKTKLDETYLKSDVVTKDFDLIKLDSFRKKVYLLISSITLPPTLTKLKFFSTRKPLL